MLKFLSLSLFMICMPTVVLAAGTEEKVTIGDAGNTFVGMLQLPDGGPAPVVLLLHGFTGSRDELPIPTANEGVFKRTARILADNGFASLRIDFRGSGESTTDMTYEKTTFEGQIADAVAAVGYLKTNTRVKSDDIYVIGWSQGGLVAASAAGRGLGVDGVALWEAVGDPKATYGGLLGAEVLKKGMAAKPDETIKIRLPWGADVAVNGAFFDGIETLNPLQEIKTFSGPLFVTKGTRDETVLPAVADGFIAAHDGEEELWTADMDHVFSVFTNTETLDKMVAQTIAFFKAHDD